jgi:hypothetical protein
MPVIQCDTRWANGDFIFVGTVASKLGGQFPISNRTLSMGYEVHFSSVEILRGKIKPDEATTLYTGRGGGDCGYPFVVGERYVVYAVNLQGHLATAICTQTAPAATMSATIRELRKLRDEGRSDDLFGNISIAPRNASVEGWLTARPFPKITVRATGKKGLRAFPVTDDQGSYAFASLPPDEYEIDEDLPSDFHKNGSRLVDLQYAQMGLAVGSIQLLSPTEKSPVV